MCNPFVFPRVPSRHRSPSWRRFMGPLTVQVTAAAAGWLLFFGTAAPPPRPLTSSSGLLLSLDNRCVLWGEGLLFPRWLALGWSVKSERVKEYRRHHAAFESNKFSGTTFGAALSLWYRLWTVHYFMIFGCCLTHDNTTVSDWHDHQYINSNTSYKPVVRVGNSEGDQTRFHNWPIFHVHTDIDWLYCDQ